MTLEELHNKLYDLLCIVDDICKKEGVRWFIDGGTEIGAVREKNFVPWDDDLDIKVLREDYEAFKAAMIKHLPSNYRFIEPEEFSPYFYDFVPRVVDTEQLLRTVTDEDTAYKNYQNCVGFDVFILENAPSGALARKLMHLKLKMIYGMAMSKRYKLHKEGYSFTQRVVSGVCMLLGKFFKLETIFKLQNKSMTKYLKKYENKQVEYRFPSNDLLRDMMFFPDELFRDVAFGEIRGRKFPIPVGYDRELTMIYGDYMHPPKDPSIYKNHLEQD